MKKVIAGLLAATTIVGTSSLWVLKTNKGEVKLPAYTVKEVFDGDSFITNENQSVRLASVNAPELENCGGKEAIEGLSDMLSGKQIYLKVLYVDNYRRMNALVYTDEGLVNTFLLEKGLVYYSGTSNEPAGISDHAKVAKDKSLGIFGPKCTQTDPPNKKCIIKGNKRLRAGGTAFYTFPGCRTYPTALVQLYLGDQWFCSEKEAQKAGFTKGEDCMGKSWK